MFRITRDPQWMKPVAIEILWRHEIDATKFRCCLLGVLSDLIWNIVNRQVGKHANEVGQWIICGIPDFSINELPIHDQRSIPGRIERQVSALTDYAVMNGLIFGRVAKRPNLRMKNSPING